MSSLPISVSPLTASSGLSPVNQAGPTATSVSSAELRTPPATGSDKPRKGQPIGLKDKPHQNVGSKNEGKLVASSDGNFMTCTIIVDAGEDVTRKIMALSQHGPHSVCVLSANGVISITLQQIAYGDTCTFEVLAGSFQPSDQ